MNSDFFANLIFHLDKIAIHAVFEITPTRMSETDNFLSPAG